MLIAFPELMHSLGVNGRRITTLARRVTEWGQGSQRRSFGVD